MKSSARSFLVLGSVLLASCPSTAATSTIGRTWPIAEPDALSEIEAKVAALPPDMSKRFGPRGNWSAMQAVGLPAATATRTRSVVPFYTLDQDIKLPDGRVLYPKGFSFNPLAYVTLPNRLVIVQPRDLSWALRVARPQDMILLTGGDALALTETTGRQLYILQPSVRDRLQLTVAPVVVRQVAQRLELTETVLKRRADGSPVIDGLPALPAKSVPATPVRVASVPTGKKL